MQQKHIENPIGADSAITDIEAIVRRFQDVLTAETNALKKSDLDAFRQHSEQKISLAYEYQKLLEQLQIQRRKAPKLSDTQRQKLDEIGKAFKATLRDNADALTNSKKAVERVVNRITRIACETANQKKQTYTAYGKLNTPQNRPVSTIIDQA